MSPLAGEISERNKVRRSSYLAMSAAKNQLGDARTWHRTNDDRLRGVVPGSSKEEQNGRQATHAPVGQQSVFLGSGWTEAPDPVAHRKGASIFLLLRCGDIHPNPGPRRGVRSGERAINRKNQDSQSITIIQMNVDGIRARKAELEHLIVNNRPDILCLQETKLKKDAVFKINGYTCVRKERTTPRQGSEARGGGIAILVKDCAKFSFMEIHLNEIDGDETTERMCIEVTHGKNTIKIYNFYVPPIRGGGEDQRTQNFQASRALVAESHNIITGDFNAHYSYWDNNAKDDNIGIDIADWMSDNNYNIANTGDPTFMSRSAARKSSPDITMSSEDIIIRNWKILPALNTEHRPLEFNIHQDDLDLEIDNLPQKKTMQTRYSWAKANWNQFSEKVDMLLECSNYTGSKNLSHRIKRLTEAIVTAGRSIPRGCRKDPKAWWSNDIADAVDERNRLRDEAEKDPDKRRLWLDAKRECPEAHQRRQNESVETIY